MQCWRRAILVGAGMLALAGSARADVKIEQTTYHGWPGAYRMTNGVVELIVVPQIGRIMRYGYVGGPNALWENPALAGQTTDLTSDSKEWRNYGGDKLWPAPQSKWGWPPDPTADSGPQTALVTPDNHLHLIGPDSKAYGVRFEREISLANKGVTVTLRNVLHNVSGREIEWGVWQITQTDAPHRALLPLSTKSKWPRGYYAFDSKEPPPGVTVEGKTVVYRRDAKQAGKIGGFHPAGWVAMEKGDTRFEVSIPNLSQYAGAFPDDGCALEIYGSNDPLPYMELELLGPVAKIGAESQLTLTTRWRLTKIRR